MGGLATVVGGLPLFLTGAMVVQITDDLLFGTVGLGIAVALYRLAGAATAHHLGRLVDRIGAVAALRVAALIAMMTSVGIATTAVNLYVLSAWLMVAATANVFAQPAANRLMVRTVPARRQGFAFGVKQSAPPVASMLAGASVPLIAVTAGWRWAYLLGAVLALVVLVAAGRRPGPSRRAAMSGRSRSKLRDRRTVVALSVAVGLSTVASTPVLAFFVDASVRAGTSPELAGTLLGIASAAAILTRLVGGAVADRMSGGHLRLCAGMLIVGAVGIALLAMGTPEAMAIGLVIALMGTWGLNGVFVFALMRAYADTPGAATGATMPGALIGGIVGPITVGFIADSASYATAWLFACGAAIAASMAFILCARRLARGGAAAR